MNERALLFYLGGVASWFINLGLQYVMVPVLATLYLDVTPLELAIAQFSLSLPQILLLIFAGHIADRVDARKMLLFIHALAMLPPAFICWMVVSDQLIYQHLIIYGLSMGVLLSFSLPARDALVSRVTKRDTQQAIMMVLMTQFIAQLIGFSLAWGTSSYGVWALPFMQIITQIFGLLITLLLPAYPSLVDKNAQNQKNDQQLLAGARTIFSSPILLPMTLASLATGILFVGLFMVGLPLIVKDLYGGGQSEIAIMSFAFWCGTIATTLFLMFRPPIHHQGRFMVYGSLLGSACVVVMAIAPTYPIFLLTCIAWGICGGFNMSMSRTALQSNAPAHLRASILAFYNLAFIGAAPIGALSLSLIIEDFGIRTAPLVSGGGMMIVFIFLLWRTQIWGITRKEEN